MNRLRVVEAVRDHGAMTQVELAQLTGLSPATVSNVVRELDQSGAVHLSPSVRNGRRAVLVSLAATTGLVGAMVFGERDVRVAVGSDASTVLAESRLPLPAQHAADEGTERAGRLLSDLLDRCGHDPSELCAVVVGLPAPVDSVTGQIGSEGILPGWRGVPVAETMTRQLAVPTVLENTANLGALGELRAGALRGADQAVFVKVSHGVGAGLILGGELFRGAAGTAGELGHLTLDEDGPVCRCGNRGCLELYAGANALLQALRASHGALSLRDVIGRALAGDPACHRAVADAGRHLGVAVAGVVNLVNPDVVVVGGQLARVGELLLEPMRAAVARCAIPSAAHTVRIRTGRLGERADLVGAMVLADQLRGDAQRTVSR